jgi:predicted ABC-type transport system involved in lysophospholipase L1 biosynthesis ATPase subunit
MSVQSNLRSLRQHGSEHQAVEAVRFLQRHNLIEHDEPTGQIESETAPSSPPHRYLAEEYDFSNCMFLITDNCDVDS